MKKNKWIWMPHAGHFICGQMCRFRMNTYVGKYIVSTVGELWFERPSREIHAKVYDPQWLQNNRHLMGDEFDAAYMKKFGYEDIGLDRKYETMVFKAHKSKHKCCPWEMVSGMELDFDTYNTPEEAYKGHYKLCNKWSKK